MEKIRKGDQVVVLSGRDKGRRGAVLQVLSGHVVVESINRVKRHTKANPARQIKGGIAESEGSIDHSNVMLLTSGGVPTRVGYKKEANGARVRVAKESGETLDKK